jgi:hypothetical protein
MEVSPLGSPKFPNIPSSYSVESQAISDAESDDEQKLPFCPIEGEQDAYGKYAGWALLEGVGISFCRTRGLNVCDAISDILQLKLAPWPSFDSHIWPQFREVVLRVASFCTWPAGSPQRDQEFANDGFFFAQFSDVVVCYHCNATVCHWYEHHIVNRRHLKQSPMCKVALEHQLLPQKSAEQKKVALRALNAARVRIKEERQEVPVNKCNICFTGALEVKTNPCCHVVSCEACLIRRGSATCSFCYEPITRWERVFVI